MKVPALYWVAVTAIIAWWFAFDHLPSWLAYITGFAVWVIALKALYAYWVAMMQRK